MASIRARLATLARSAPRIRASGPTWALTVLAGVALTELPGVSASTRHGTAAAVTRRAALATAAPPAAGQARYRIVGCRSRGRFAYLHGEGRAVAIGFDDGPAAATPEFVSMLERAKAKATFFLIGRQINDSYRATLLRELRDGDALGDHTFNHPYLTRSGNAYTELHSTLAAIRSASGYTPCVFRPPYGAYDSSVVDVARSLGLATVMWNVDPRDWARPGTSSIVQQVLAQVRPGSIIISHDGGGPRAETLAAYPSIIAGLRARGYRIVTIPELLGFRPIYRPCVLLCAGIGVPRAQLPRDAVIEKAR
ncbi:MAG TPA: polysaccharide deacetylase family protein [Solirubrobacteraceae bacterium]|nr:polysaccharide deacetylase family protein [Solirubrobacteraceae bacterium]